MNVVSVLDAIAAARTVDPAQRAEVEALLAALFGEIVDPLREWIFNLECAIDQAEYHARQLDTPSIDPDTGEDVDPETGTGTDAHAVCAQAHVELVSALAYVVAELALANNNTRSGVYPATA